MDLSVFSPACLPSNGASFVGQEGHVYGEKLDILQVLICLFLRLGNHWSSGDFHGHAAGDCDSHRPKQHMHGENEPD